MGRFSIFLICFFLGTADAVALEKVTVSEDGRTTHLEIRTSPIIFTARGAFFSQVGNLAEAHANIVIYPQTFGMIEIRPMVETTHVLGTKTYLSESFVRSGVETSVRISDRFHFGATINHLIDLRTKNNDVAYDIGGIFVWGDNAAFKLGFGGAKRSGGALVFRFKYSF